MQVSCIYIKAAAAMSPFSSYVPDDVTKHHADRTNVLELAHRVDDSINVPDLQLSALYSDVLIKTLKLSQLMGTKSAR